jgi:hypothetical protein
MRGRKSGFRLIGSSALLVKPHAVFLPLNPESTNQASERRFTSWIVHLLVLATTAFAFLDLYLFVTAVHA